MMPETDSEDDEEPLPIADLDNVVGDEEPVPDSGGIFASMKFLGWPPQTPPPHSVPVTPPLQPNQGVPARMTQQPSHY